MSSKIKELSTVRTPGLRPAVWYEFLIRHYTYFHLHLVKIGQCWPSLPRHPALLPASLESNFNQGVPKYVSIDNRF